MQIKKMWLVEESLEIKKIVAIHDEAKDIVYCYVYEDDYNQENPRENPEWTSPYEHEAFFLTEGAALDYRNAKRDELKEMIQKVKSFIERMDRIESNEDFKFEKKDYLGHYAKEDDYWRRSYYDMSDKCKRLMLVIEHGVVNVNAETFKVEDVARVEWDEVNYKEDGKQKTRKAATVVLKDGHEIQTKLESEYVIIKELFGSNMSGFRFVKNGY